MQHSALQVGEKADRQSQMTFHNRVPFIQAGRWAFCDVICIFVVVICIFVDVQPKPEIRDTIYYAVTVSWYIIFTFCTSSGIQLRSRPYVCAPQLA